jgi:anti-sigma regulatory factor (Ser/Thr protein kinase)
MSEELNQSITLPNDIAAVPQLSSFVDNVCSRLNIDGSTVMQMNLALEEAVVNVMNYAYPKGTKGDVDIRALCDGAQMKFVLIDSGTPFDPTKHQTPDVQLSADERAIGGLGIFLVTQIMDNVSYERRNEKNILTLCKNLKN